MSWFKKFTKNFTPSIVIWNLEICDKESGFVLQNFYFLSYKRARKFWELHDKEFEDYRTMLGGEQLWLW